MLFRNGNNQQVLQGKLWRYSLTADNPAKANNNNNNGNDKVKAYQGMPAKQMSSTKLGKLG